MNKITKKSNTELMNEILDLIRGWGYHIKDDIKGNCYFVFEGEEDSICHFHIKEIPGFRFGLWSISRYDKIEYQMKKNGLGNTWADSLEISPLTEIIFFTQYERDLDKFKPSRSGFVTGLYRYAYDTSVPDSDEIKHIEKWRSDTLEAILYYMKHNHLRSIAYVGAQTRYIWEDYRPTYKFLLSYLSGWFYHWRYRFEDYYKYKSTYLKAKSIARKNKTSYIFIVDKGECWSPRLDMYIRRKPNVNFKQYAKDQKVLDKFEKKCFMNMSLNQYDVDILKPDLSAQDLKDDRELLEKYKQCMELYFKEMKEEKVLYSNIKESL